MNTYIYARHPHVLDKEVPKDQRGRISELIKVIAQFTAELHWRLEQNGLADSDGRWACEHFDYLVTFENEGEEAPKEAPGLVLDNQVTIRPRHGMLLRIDNTIGDIPF